MDAAASKSVTVTRGGVVRWPEHARPGPAV